MIVACRYPSYDEAMTACEKWGEGGGKYKNIFINYQGYNVELNTNIRTCWKDGNGETRVILGKKQSNVKSGDVFYNHFSPSGNPTIEKRFYY
jgi:hypothetical protein